MFLRRGSACTAPLFCAGPAVKGDGWFIGGFRETGDRPVRTPAPTGVVFYRGFPVDEHGAPGSSRPTEAGHQGRGEGFDGPSQCRESRRTMCAPTYGIPTGTAAFAAVGQRNNQQVSGASRGEGGRAAAAVYHRAIDGGWFQDTFICARVTAAARRLCTKPSHRTVEGASRLGVLRGERIRAMSRRRRG